MAEIEQIMPTPVVDPETGLADARDPDIHLQRLLAVEVEQPWYSSFVQNIKDLVNPPKLPPLEVTSKPVAVKDIWGFYGDHHKHAGASSLMIHVGVVVLLFTVASHPVVQEKLRDTVSLIAPVDLAPYMAQQAKKNPMGGGGGG